MKRVAKRYTYSPIQQKKKIPLSHICSDLSLTPKKAPISDNFRTHMLTHNKSSRFQPSLWQIWQNCSNPWNRLGKQWHFRDFSKTGPWWSRFGSTFF